MGRLDRILFNDSWIDKLPESAYTYLCTSFGDHAPMLLYLKTTPNSGPKPFRFYNYWMECEGFSSLLQSSWSNQYSGYPLYKLICKLKALKGALKTWSVECQVHSPRQKIDIVRATLSLVQQQIHLTPMDVQLQEEERKLTSELEYWFGLEESRLKQKSREQWLNLGDKNNKFIYAMTKSRHSFLP